MSEAKLDKELSWPNIPGLETAATSPITYPLATGTMKRLDEEREWVRAMAIITSAQFISEFELSMLVKFEMLKWLGCEFRD